MCTPPRLVASALFVEYFSVWTTSLRFTNPISQWKNFFFDAQSESH